MERFNFAIVVSVNYFDGSYSLSALVEAGWVILTGSEPAILSSRPCSSFLSKGSKDVSRFDLGGTWGSAPRFFVAGCLTPLRFRFAIRNSSFVETPREPAFFLSRASITRIKFFYQVDIDTMFARFLGRGLGEVPKNLDEL
jgi:hypothetical protein